MTSLTCHMCTRSQREFVCPSCVASDVQHRRTELDYQSAVTAQLEQRVASHVLQHQQRTPPPVHRIQRLDQLRAQIERLRKQNEKERVEVSALLSEVEHRRRVFDRFVDKMESTARLRTAVLSGRIQPAIKDASEKVKRIDDKVALVQHHQLGRFLSLMDIHRPDEADSVGASTIAGLRLPDSLSPYLGQVSNASLESQFEPSSPALAQSMVMPPVRPVKSLKSTQLTPNRRVQFQTEHNTTHTIASSAVDPQSSMTASQFYNSTGSESVVLLNQSVLVTAFPVENGAKLSAATFKSPTDPHELSSEASSNQPIVSSKSSYLPKWIFGGSTFAHSSAYTTTPDLEHLIISAGIGYVCFAVQYIARYLDIVLPFPIHYAGSRSAVHNKLGESFELYFSEASTIAPEVRTVGVRLLNNNISFLLSRIHTKVDQLPMMALVHSLGDQSSGLPALLQCCFKLGFPAFDYLRQREVQKLESNKKIQLAQARKSAASMLAARVSDESSDQWSLINSPPPPLPSEPDAELSLYEQAYAKRHASAPLSKPKSMLHAVTSTMSTISSIVTNALSAGVEPGRLAVYDVPATESESEPMQAHWTADTSVVEDHFARPAKSIHK